MASPPSLNALHSGSLNNPGNLICLGNVLPCLSFSLDDDQIRHLYKSLPLDSSPQDPDAEEPSLWMRSWMSGNIASHSS